MAGSLAMFLAGDIHKTGGGDLGLARFLAGDIRKTCGTHQNSTVGGGDLGQEEICGRIFRYIGQREAKASPLLRTACEREREATRMPTWTVTQYHHQTFKLEAIPSVTSCLCQHGRVNQTTPRASSSRQLEAAGPSSSGRLVATEDLSNEKKVHLHPNTDGENTLGSSTILNEEEEEHELRIKYLNGKCARFVEYPANLQYFPLNVAIWELIYERLLKGFVLAYQGS